MRPAWRGVLDQSSLRLIAPEASRVEDYTQPFIALDWPGLPASTALAAMLEQGSPYPMQNRLGGLSAGRSLKRKAMRVHC